MNQQSVEQLYGALPLDSEAFRFVNLRALTSATWLPNSAETDLQSSVAYLDLLPEASTRIVFIDGAYQEELSHIESGIELTKAVSADTPATEAQTIESINRSVNNIDYAIDVRRSDEASIVSIIYYHTEKSTGTISHPRISLRINEGITTTVVEQFAGAGTVYAINACTDFHVAANAHVRHYRLQNDDKDAVHVATTNVTHEGNDATFHSLAVNLGASLFRHDILARLNASNVETTFNGIVLLSGNQISDTRSRIEHLQPGSRSNELYKSVLGDQSRGIFRGRIFVDQIAQQTDAFQSNPSMLLTDDAVANSNPELEIYADDVRCTHGATCGDIEDEAVFYLQSRGFGRDQAKNLLIYAFLSELLEEIHIDTLKTALNQQIQQKLAQLTE